MYPQKSIGPLKLYKWSHPYFNVLVFNEAPELDEKKMKKLWFKISILAKNKMNFQNSSGGPLKMKNFDFIRSLTSAMTNILTSRFFIIQQDNLFFTKNR